MTIQELRELSMADWFMAEMGNDFWTSLDELVSDIEEYGYRVLDANDEYITVENDTDDDEDETLLYLGHAGNTMWIVKARSF